MMKAVVFALLVAVVFAAKWDSSINQCSISGDPHYVTFDGNYHDFMGVGTYRVAKNEHFEVQSNMLVCSGSTVSCVRASTVSVLDWENPQAPKDLVSWGYWSGTGYDPIEISTAGGKQVITVANAKNTLLVTTGIVTQNGGVVKFNPANNQLTISRTYTFFGEQGASTRTWTVVIAAMYMVISVPNTDAYWGTNGLCGLYDGKVDGEFTHADGVIAIPAVVANTRYNGAAVNAWGASFTVGRNRIEPLASVHFHQNEKFEIFPFEGVNNASVPTPAEQALLDEVKMDWASYVEVEKQCREAAQGDTGAYENCVYDAIHLADSTIKNQLIASNIAASLTVSQLQNAPADNTLAPGAIAGIVVGCFAAVALAFAGFSYYRLRVAKEELHALIPHATAGTSSAGISL